MVLTKADRAELHAAIVTYLASRRVPGDTLQALQAHLSASGNAAAAGDDALADDGGIDGLGVDGGALERRWGTLRRLALANANLEAQVRRLEGEAAERRDPMRGASNALTSSSLAVAASTAGGGVVQAAAASPSLPVGPEPVHRFVGGHRDAITSVALHPFDPVAFTASSDGTARVWDLAQRRQRQVLSHCDAVACVAVEPTTGALLACAVAEEGAAAAVMIYELAPGGEYDATRTLRPPHEQPVTCLAWCGGEQSGAARVLVSAGHAGVVCAWDAERGQLLATIALADGVSAGLQAPAPRVLSLAAAPARFAVAGTADGNVWVIDDAAAVAAVAGGGGEARCVRRVHAAAVSAIALPDFNAQSTLIDAFASADRRAERRQHLQQQQQQQAASAAGPQPPPARPQFAVTGGRDKDVVLLDLVRGVAVQRFAVHGAWVTSVVMLAQPGYHPRAGKPGVFAATAGDDETIRVVDVTQAATGAEVRRIDAAHVGGVTAMAVDPRGGRALLASVGADRTLAVWGFASLTTTK
jgi:WD40 repeat protein